MGNLHQNIRQDRFTGPMYRRLWAPAMVSSLGWALSDMADAVVVGQRLGTVGLAAIGLILPVYMVNCMMAHGLGLGDRCGTAQGDGPDALLAAPCPGTSDAGPRADGGPGAGYVSEIQQSVPGKFAGALALCHGPGAGDGPPSRAGVPSGREPLAVWDRGRAPAPACTSNSGGRAMRRRQWNLSLQPKLLLGMMVAALVIVLTPAISKVYRDQMEEYYTW